MNRKSGAKQSCRPEHIGASMRQRCDRVHECTAAARLRTFSYSSMEARQRLASGFPCYVLTVVPAALIDGQIIVIFRWSTAKDTPDLCESVCCLSWKPIPENESRGAPEQGPRQNPDSRQSTWTNTDEISVSSAVIAAPGVFDVFLYGKRVALANGSAAVAAHSRSARLSGAGKLSGDSMGIDTFRQTVNRSRRLIPGSRSMP